MNTKQVGTLGEKAAEEFLKKHGYKVVANNYATSGSELDLVAYKRGILVFAEVKTRSSDAFGAPAEAVNQEKRYRLRNAARGFWFEQNKYGKLPVWSWLCRDFVLKKVKLARLDIIEVYLDNGTVSSINHLENQEIYSFIK